MALTAAQMAVLKADIAANADLNVHPDTSDGAFEIAKLYNLPAVPAFTVWRTDVPTKDVKKAVVWTEYIGATSQGERDAFELMIANGIVNAADTNVRAGFNDIFSGPQKAGTRANLTAMAKRAATRVEKLFSTGTGSDASPATMTVEGALSWQDVVAARSS